MCRCSAEKFQNEGNEYVRKLCHFNCKYNDSHIVYILSCEKHPYVASNISEMDPKCKCPSIGALEICNFCRQVRYLFNFRAFKFCLKRILQDHVVTTNQHFKRMSGCQPFFDYSKELGRTDIYLDNPRESLLYIKKLTVNFFFFFFF